MVWRIRQTFHIIKLQPVGVMGFGPASLNRQMFFCHFGELGNRTDCTEMRNSKCVSLKIIFSRWFQQKY